MQGNKKVKSLNIYTDGACSRNPGAGGYSAVILRDGFVEYVAGYVDRTTNNRMELAGMLVALELADFAINYENYGAVYIHTDSKYVENAVNCGWLKKWIKNDYKNIKNSDLWKQISLLLFKGDKIHVKWVKGHSGIEGNVLADEFASEALEQKRSSRGSIKYK